MYILEVLPQYTREVCIMKFDGLKFACICSDMNNRSHTSVSYLNQDRLCTPWLKRVSGYDMG